MQSCAVRASILVLGVLLAASPASGGEESLGTVQLRGGYDADDTLDGGFWHRSSETVHR